MDLGEDILCPGAMPAGAKRRRTGAARPRARRGGARAYPPIIGIIGALAGPLESGSARAVAPAILKLTRSDDPRVDAGNPVAL